MILPEAFLERMEKMLGEEYPDFLKAYEEDKYQALRLNALKYNMDGISAAQLKKQREDWLAELKAVPWAENGYYYSGRQKLFDRCRYQLPSAYAAHKRNRHAAGGFGRRAFDARTP